MSLNCCTRFAFAVVALVWELLLLLLLVFVQQQGRGCVRCVRPRAAWLRPAAVPPAALAACSPQLFRAAHRGTAPVLPRAPRRPPLPSQQTHRPPRVRLFVVASLPLLLHPPALPAWLLRCSRCRPWAQQRLMLVCVASSLLLLLLLIVALRPRPSTPHHHCCRCHRRWCLAGPSCRTALPLPPALPVSLLPAASPARPHCLHLMQCWCCCAAAVSAVGRGAGQACPSWRGLPLSWSWRLPLLLAVPPPPRLAPHAPPSQRAQRHPQ